MLSAQCSVLYPGANREDANREGANREGANREGANREGVQSLVISVLESLC